MRRSTVLVLSLWTLISVSAALSPAVAEPPGAAPPTAYNPAADYRRGVEALRVGRIDQAEAAANAILSAQPQLASGSQLLGLVKVRRGDLTGAVAEFDKALAHDAQFIQAREERAVILARLGQPQRARIDLEALRARAAACARDCPPDLRRAISRIEAALVAGRPSSARDGRGANRS